MAVALVDVDLHCEVAYKLNQIEIMGEKMRRDSDETMRYVTSGFADWPGVYKALKCHQAMCDAITVAARMTHDMLDESLQD